MFLSRNKKNNVYPCKPQFYYIKVGFKGVNIIWACFRDDAEVKLSLEYILFEPGHSVPTRLHVRPAKTQISLRNRAFPSESSKGTLTMI